MKNLSRSYSIVEIVLRLGIFGTFLGHGIFAFFQKTEWIPFLTFWGFSEHSALQLMPIIGIIDILVAISILVKPMRPVILYAFIWALLTAMMRPLVGQGVLEFIERSANFAAPLALYFFLASDKKE